MSDAAAAWLAYYGSVCLLLLVLWRLLYRVKSAHIRRLILLIAAFLIATPVPTGEDFGHWSPGLIAALLEFIMGGTSAALPLLWPVLLVTLLAVVIHTLVIYRLRRQPAAVAKPGP